MQFQGFQNVQVTQIYNGNPAYGCKWIIMFNEYFAAIPAVTISGSGLMGGKSGTSPTINYYVARPYSSHIFFNPVG